MTICRYYAQGTCRFGDRCRFEHVDPDYNSYNQRNTGNYQERHGHYDTGYSNYQSENQYGNQRYQTNRYASNQRSSSPNYQDNYRYENPRYSNDYQYESRTRQTYEPPSRYNDQNYGKSQQYSSRNYQNENIYSENRYRWLSDDYKKHESTEPVKNKFANESFNTSTPKGKVSFSFKVPESEIKKPAASSYQVNEDDQLHVELVKEDAKAWELGGQWPFSCYFPVTSKHGFPSFYDVSPEELRYAAYKSEKNNCYENYVQAVQSTLAQINNQRSQMQIPTPQLLSVLRQIWNGEDVYSMSNKFDPLSIMEGQVTTIESMETPAFATPSVPFSFKIPTETDSSSKISVSNFSFKLPAGTEIKPVAAVSSGDPEIYTPLDKLTEEEKKQFQASTFVLGKIPTKPPPQMFCS